MKLVELDSSSRFANQKRTEILIRKAGQTDFRHHCDAIVLSEASDGFVLVCALPCIEALGQTFHVRRSGFSDPVGISLSAVLSHIRVQERDFGFVHSGVYL